MKCPNCGEELSDGVLFCRECGHKIQREPQKRFCRECGAELEPNAKFCSTCGAKVLTEEDIIREGIVNVPPYDDDDDERGVQVVNVPHDEKVSLQNFDSDEVGTYSKTFVDDLKFSLKTLWRKMDRITHFYVIAVCIFLLALFISVVFNKTLSAIASVAQVVSLCVLYAIHVRTIKTDKKWVSLISVIIIILMIPTYIGCFDVSKETAGETVENVETQPSIETTAYILGDDEVQINFSRYDLTGKHYADVTYMFQSLGFSNIDYRVKYDVIYGFLFQEGDIFDVSIAGRTDFESGDVFKKEDPVFITYHASVESDPNKKVEAQTAAPANSSLGTETQADQNDEMDSTITTQPIPNQDVTKGMKNALRSAKDYLLFMAFSRNGLIEQLEFEGYSNDEATYAVDNCDADWNEQAARSAKHYLSNMSFSRQGLIEQLEFEGFTHDEAVYAVDKVY